MLLFNLEDLLGFNKVRRTETECTIIIIIITTHTVQLLGLWDPKQQVKSVSAKQKG